MLGHRVAVISPHLDDAAFSVGSLIHQQARLGASVMVVTVFGNDPDAEEVTPSAWDRACGFASPSRAARTRRQEDRRACAILGARPVWLPFADRDHGGEAAAERMRHPIAEAIAGADAILIPGFPLAHPDHRLAAALVMELREQLEARIFLYAEQPYAAGRLLGAREWGTRAEGALAVTRDVMRFGLKLASGATPMQASVTLAGQTLEDVRWCAVRTSRVDRGAKQRAIRSYASQLEPLGIRAMLGARVYEAARRGETLAAVSSTAPG